MTITRRTALKTLGAMAGTAGATRLLPGCGESDDGPVGIHHIVYVMMENRSYDHQLGRRALMGLGGNGVTDKMTNPNRKGADIGLFVPPITDLGLCTPDPPHSWTNSHLQFTAGTNQGFVTTHQMSYDDDSLIDPMQSLTRDHAPVLWALADEYTTCDNYFCSVMGPTWPNRFYWLTGTSMGMQGNDIPEEPFPTSIFHRLTEKGVDWRCYHSGIPFIALINAPVEGHIGGVEQFITDAANGRLPAVSYLEPNYTLNDDHPPHHPLLAQQFLAAIYTALATSPQWKNTLLLITYDEHGGFFDHVPPPTIATDAYGAQGFNQLGFRVPAYIVGPYAKQGYVSSTQLEHCSALRHLVDHFDLEQINDRVAGSNDLSDGIDEDALAAGAPRDPITVPAVEVNETELDDMCFQSTKRERDIDLYQYARANPQRFARFARRDPRDDLYLIGDFLEKHNVGRIVRRR